MLPLSDITVIAIEHAIAAPFCTRQLADLGARVIKIERPGAGDFARGYDDRVKGLASHFVWVNRAKESLAIDLKEPSSKQVLDKLLERADVIVQNLAPGASERLGLGFTELHTKYPDLIVCDISGYGNNGPYRDKKAYDLLIQSESGFLSVTGTAADMAKAGCSIADISAGMYAYTNILAALIERNKTGRGKHIEISMLESMAEWMSYPMYYAFAGASAPARSGAAHATIYPYGPFMAGDGKTIMLGLQNEREWQLFCSAVLQQPDLAVDSRFDTNIKRSAARAELNQIINQVFAGLSAADINQRLQQAKIASADVNQMADVWAHPQLKARQRWTTVDTPAGPIPALLPPGINDTAAANMGPVPALGEHTDAILAELGITSDSK